jgi:hypothetical protein
MSAGAPKATAAAVLADGLGGPECCERHFDFVRTSG